MDIYTYIYIYVARRPTSSPTRTISGAIPAEGLRYAHL